MPDQDNPQAMPISPEGLADSAPKAKKPKKQTAAEARKELEDLKESALTTRQKLTQAEINFQKARTILRSEGTPGMTMNQDHFRLKCMVDDLRKLFNVEPEEISGGQ